MDRPCICNQFCVAVCLLSMFYSGICIDRPLDTKHKVGVGQKQSQNSTYARIESHDSYYETSSPNIKSLNSARTLKKSQYASSSGLHAIIKDSATPHANPGRIGSAFDTLSSADVHPESSFSLPAWSQTRASPAHFNRGNSIDNYSTHDTHSAQPTPASLSVTPLSMSSFHSMSPLSATSYHDMMSYNSVHSSLSADAISITPTPSMTTSISSLWRSVELSKILSSSQLMITSSQSFLTLSTVRSSISSNSAKSLGKTTSLHSPAIPYTASVTSISPVPNNASSISALVTHSLETLSIEILSVSSVSPSSSQIIFTSASFSVVSNQSDILPIANTGCNVVLDGLAGAMGQMTFCLIKHLRPIEVCAECTKFHSKLRKYENLIHTTQDCEKELVLDYNAQYQAVRKMYKVQYDMWQDFECEKCYKDRSDTVIPSAPWVPKEEFLESQLLIKDIMVCFANYSQSKIALPYPVMLNMSNSGNRTSPNQANMICTKCKDMYKKLREYMKSIHIEGSAEKRWCADMVYGFNETRRVWGEFCITHNEDRESIIALTCFFCFLPVVFYIGTKLHSDVKERKNESRVNYDSD